MAGAVVGVAAAVGGAAAVVGLGAPPVWQALTKSANADAPAASKRILRIWVLLLSRRSKPCRGPNTHDACSLSTQPEAASECKLRCFNASRRLRPLSSVTC